MNKTNLRKVREAILEFKENFHYGHALDYKRELDTIESYKYGSLLVHESSVCGCVIGFSLGVNKRECDATVRLDLSEDEMMFLFRPFSNRTYRSNSYLYNYQSEIYPFGFDYPQQGHEADAYKEAISRIDYLLALGQ